jgi:TPR repeat protein
MKDGKPVKILASVEVRFRFPGLWFDEKGEGQRTSFNIAVQNLKRNGNTPAQIDRSVKSVLDLARHNFPPAMCLVGNWKRKGEHVDKDPGGGLALVQKAAAKNYGPALYEIAICRMNGLELPKDFEKGLDEMRRASILGSAQAQFHLGNRYEKGDGVPRELDRAGRYYRLCAAQGVALCQYRLANLLLMEPGRRERDYVQAVAWLQLASEQGFQEATGAAASEAARLTPTQKDWVNSLKTQLVHK